jgi:hypothetical protein
MRATKIILFLLIAVSLSACGKQETKTLSPCASKEACLNDPDCLCWCSQICNWRRKTASDHPVYIENDPYGKFCYCKQWDFDHYEDNCIYGKKIQEPPDAK